MKYIISILLLLICILTSNAQVVDSLNQNVSPKNGLNQLAIKYYGIDFTKEQRKEIENVEIEFIYSVDAYGNPVLTEEAASGVREDTEFDVGIRRYPEVIGQRGSSGD